MNWEELEASCNACERCALGKKKKNCVFGCGNREARLMFVGEAPGGREDELGIPFVGAAGQLLDKFFIATGISREDVYIANILKCRPEGNRDPAPEEQEACIGWLREQVKLVRPRVIVCLGRIAAGRLISPELRITRDHGKLYKRGSYTMTAVYHPAALLRDPGKKEDMYKDMKMIAGM